MNIVVEFSSDSLFGGWESRDLACVDVPASVSKFREMLDAALRVKYPEAAIEVRYGLHDFQAVDDDRASVEAECVGNVVAALFEAQEWVVDAPITLIVASAATGIPLPTLYAAAQKGRLATRRSGKTWLTTRAEVEDYRKGMKKRTKGEGQQ